MASLNRVTLIGHLGRDPEIRTFSEGVKKATFTMATTERYKDKTGDWKDETQWHNISAFRLLADRAENYLKKGMQVYVEGKLTTRTYTDKDGTEKRFTEIVANSIILLGKREASEAAEHPAAEKDEIGGLPDYSQNVEDDLPF